MKFNFRRIKDFPDLKEMEENKLSKTILMVIWIRRRNFDAIKR